MTGEPQTGLRFRVRQTNGREETMLVDAERALIGSAAHCEVRLDPEIAPPELLEVYASEGVVHFKTRIVGQARPPLLDGAPALEGAWRAESVLDVAGVTLEVEPISLAPAKARAPLWALLLAIPLVGFAVAMTLITTPARAGTAIPEPPELFAPGPKVECPSVPFDQVLALAEEKLRVANALRERSPFAPQDGIESVELFNTAAACFRASARPTEATEAERAATELRSKIEEEYRVRRIRLEHAFKMQDAVRAKREIAVLQPLLAKRPGPYADWVAAMDRAATAVLEQRGRL